jgi:two-component system nitrate/nitrite sensor histidine kinase NarX
LALIVLLSTAIGVTGMAISGSLVQGVQGNAHAINEAGSLRMQSYRLLAAVPLTQDDQPLIDEMERTAFSPELERAATRDGQESQLKSLQGYWHSQLKPGLKRCATCRRRIAGRRRFCLAHRCAGLLFRPNHRTPY